IGMPHEVQLPINQHRAHNKKNREGKLSDHGVGAERRFHGFAGNIALKRLDWSEMGQQYCWIHAGK
ncbi:MAG: hypothetical protein ACE5G1_12885, partial [bacterium]